MNADEIFDSVIEILTENMGKEDFLLFRDALCDNAKIFAEMIEEAADEMDEGDDEGGDYDDIDDDI